MDTSSVWSFSGPVSRAEEKIERTKEPGKRVRAPRTHLQHPFTGTLNYPPKRSSLPVHPHKSCGLSSAVQAAVEGNLADSVTRVTDDRTRPVLHPRLNLRWRSCHANPT